MLPHQPVYYQDGQYLVPAAGSVQRSSSVSGQRPAHINIYNDYAAAFDDHSVRRPSSAHGSPYYDDVEDRYYERPRAASRVRRPSASPQPELDPETKEKLKQLDELKKKEEEKAQQKRIEEKLLMERVKKEAELAEREKEDKELRKKAIEEFKLKEEEERLKKKKEKEREDEEFRERMRKTLWANGYSKEQIERMMKKAERPEGDSGEKGTIVLNRPTYIKVHRKHLDPETLDVYQLPWDWDDRDSSYIIIKQWIPEADQDILFDHTRKVRETRRLVCATSDMKKEKEQLLLVRRKEPKRRSWFYT